MTIHYTMYNHWILGKTHKVDCGVTVKVKGLDTPVTSDYSKVTCPKCRAKLAEWRAALEQLKNDNPQSLGTMSEMLDKLVKAGV